MRVSAIEKTQMSIPYLFRCPISLDLFTDPVTLSTGQTYDRPSIEKWLADGHLTCPVTMQRLHDTSLVPNHTLRHLIEQWIFNRTDMNSRRRKITNFSLSSLKQNLQPTSAISASTKLETLKEVRALSLESDIGQACLIQLGFFPLLLEFLIQSSPLLDSDMVEVALDCVLSLSPTTHLSSLNMLNQDSVLGSLVLLLDRPSVKIKTSLCYLIETIASSTLTHDLCLALGKTRELVQALVSLLKSRDGEAAVRAISGICSLEENRENAIKEGAVDGLVFYLSGCARRNAAKALATLEGLVGMEMGKRALMKNMIAVKVLVRLVFRVSGADEGGEYAVGLLLVVCKESARVRVEAVNTGLVTQLLLLLQSQYGGKAKSKARALLKLLRAMWGEEIRGV